MATEVNTFSAAIDLAISLSGRADRRTLLTSYLRQTIRETQVLAEFMKDLVEDQLTVTSTPFVWTAPYNLRQMIAVSYDIYDEQGVPIHPDYIVPGKRQRRHEYFYYLSGDSYIFNGVSTENTINVAYLAYVPNLPYVEEAARSARYLVYAGDDEGTEDAAGGEWVYATGITTAEQKEAARARVTNWLLFNWFDTMVEGTLAKLYKAVSDDRASASYAQYKAQQTSILKGESIAAPGGYR